MKSIREKSAIDETKKEGTRMPDSESKRIKSDYPLSEKDEVKKAETKLQNAVKKQEQKKK